MQINRDEKSQYSYQFYLLIIKKKSIYTTLRFSFLRIR